MNPEQKVLDIGTITGKVLVFGGVYSNLPALEKLMEIADNLGIPASNIICTGDIVGYCAQPEACVQCILQWGIHSIAGNVEMQLRDGEADCGCNFDEGSRCDTFSRKWYPFAQSKLSEKSIEWMKQLPLHLRFQYGQSHVYVLHGAYDNESEFVFQSSPWAQKQNSFQAAEADVILAGHCGLPFSHAQNGLLWLNAGVIGMPANDGTPRVWYMVLDAVDDNLKFQHIPFQYDHERAAELMEQNHLPSEYSGTLRSGLWDNCEILPAIETAAQGKQLSF